MNNEGAASKATEPEHSGSPIVQLPPRDPRLEASLLASADDAFKLQKAGYDENPPGSTTFSEMRRQNPFDYVASMDPVAMPARSYAYYLDSLASDDDALLPVRRERFWGLLRTASQLLLSDGRTHHYTMVHRVDHSAGTLDLVDSWPDAIFLRKGLNTRGVAAEIIHVPDRGKIVRVTRAEFERVIMGVITLEPHNFYEHLLKLFPDSANEPRFLLAIGLAAFGLPGSEDPGKALPYVDAALESVMNSEDAELKRRTGLQALYMTAFAEYWLAGHKIDEITQKKTIEVVQKISRCLRSHFSGVEHEELTHDQLNRIGAEAWASNYAQDAEQIFDSVIKRWPESGEGYFGRAKAGDKLLRPKETIDDCTTSIQLMLRSLETGKIPNTLTEQSNAYQVVDFVNAAPERNKIHFMLAECHVLRGNARNSLEDYSGAEADGKSAIALQPSNFEAHLVTATSLYERGKQREALPFYASAKNLAGDPALAGWLESRIAEIESMTCKA
jgi:hypothetical protein